MSVWSWLAGIVRPRKAVEVLSTGGSTHDSIQRHDFDNYWANANGGSADAMLDPEYRRIMRNRARMEVQNNAWLQGMLDTYVSQVVGTTLRLQVIPDEISQMKAANRIERLFDEWASETGFVTEVRSLVRARPVDGEGLGVIETCPNYDSPVSMRFRAYEADYFGDPWGFNEFAMDSAKWYDGIRFDTYGRPVSYYKFDEHPGAYRSYGLGGQGQPVPADYVCHLFKKRRPNQSRGFTELACVLDLMVALRRYRDAAVAAARTSANMSTFIKSNMEPGSADEIEDGPFTQIPMPNNAIMNLPEGWEPVVARAEHPTMTYDAFTLAIMREACRALAMPVAVATGDSSQMNYASGRLDKQAGDKVNDCDRDQLNRDTLNKVAREWMREAKSIAGFLPRIGKYRIAWQYDGRPHVDPLKEAGAVMKLKQVGLLDEERYWAETAGKSLDEAYAMLARVKAAREAAGLEDELANGGVQQVSDRNQGRTRRSPRTLARQDQTRDSWSDA